MQAHAVLCVLVLLLAGSAGSAGAVLQGYLQSFPELDLPKLFPQNDGNSGEDAQDTCIPFEEPTTPMPFQDVVHGQLVVLEDDADVYSFRPPPDTLITIVMTPASMGGQTQFPNYDLLVLRMDCATELGRSENPGNLPEQVTFLMPASDTYVVVVVYIAETLGVPIPIRFLPGEGGSVQRYHCDPVCTPQEYSSDSGP